MSLMQSIAAHLSLAWWRMRYQADELIVLVDDAGEPTAMAPKLRAHNAATKLHLAFSLFLFNSRGETLLQRRATTKKTWPGVWSNSCCGHPMLYESTKHAAARRLQTELGLTAEHVTIAIPDFRYRAEKDGIVENEICPVLVGLCDSDPIPNASEVAEYRWIDWNDLISSLDAYQDELSPWAVREALLLSTNETFRRWYGEQIPEPGRCDNLDAQPSSSRRKS